MKKLLLLTMFVSVSAFAQVVVGVAVPVVPVVVVPTIRFVAPPPLAVVEPGIQVVQGTPGVYFADGFYWHEREGRWFRSADHQGHWSEVDHAHVPNRLQSHVARAPAARAPARAPVAAQRSAPARLSHAGHRR